MSDVIVIYILMTSWYCQSPTGNVPAGIPLTSIDNVSAAFSVTSWEQSSIDMYPPVFMRLLGSALWITYLPVLQYWSIVHYPRH